MLKDAFTQGVHAAYAKLGLALPPPATKALTPGHGLPAPVDLPAKPLVAPSPASALGKEAANVGMGASSSTEMVGGGRGEPADVGRRQRSVVDRAFQANEDLAMTSSMPAPGANVSP